MGSVKLYPGLAGSNYLSDHDLLKNSALARELSSEALDALIRAGRVEYYRRGDTLFRQRENPTHIFLLLQGKVSLTTSRESGECTIVEMISAGKMLLTSSAILNTPYLVTGEAITDLRVFSISIADFTDLVAKHPSIALVALRQMANNSLTLVNQVRQLKLQSANERLAHYILSRLDRTEGSVITELDEERRVIAQRLGMTPESLSRSIAALKTVGVTFEQRTVRVTDAVALRNYCGLDVIPACS